MNDFSEIAIREIEILTEGGQPFANGMVCFQSSDGSDPVIRVELSVETDPEMTVSQLQRALATKAIRLLREVSELPDDTIPYRIQAGSLSILDRSEFQFPE